MNSAFFRIIGASLPKKFIGLFLSIFLVVTFFGVFTCMNRIMMGDKVGMNQKQSMSDCTGMGQQNGCTMSIGEHLTIWQNIFTPHFDSDFLALIAMAFALAIIFSIFKILFPPDTVRTASYRCYMQAHQGFRLYNYLLAIFASGIIQPKLFA